MKVSLNTIKLVNKHYGSAGDPAPEGVDKLVEKIGAQLAGVEGVERWGLQFEGIVIVQVISCQKHANADKLNICMVDDNGLIKNVERNSSGHIQVVCGAPNVRADMLAVWIPPGVTVPSTLGKEPLKIEPREIRGQTSHGMLASAAELGISDDHSGILEITDDIKHGTFFTKAYNLEGEAVIEMENKMFTHRPDCFGQLGIAREIEGISGRPYKSPDWYTSNPTFPSIEADELKLEVNNKASHLVPRFTAITMSEVEVKSSPVWLQLLLAEIGMRPINNIVDYTNFFMFETGQPLHAYDYDKLVKISGQQHVSLETRLSHKGEKLNMLNGKTLELQDDSTVLITSNDVPIGLGGVMGGADTEVDGNTRNIVLECANFDMYSIRRTAMQYGLFTDAVTRFTKGQSPLQNLGVLAKIVDEIRRFAAGKVASVAIDKNSLSPEIISRNSLYKPVKVGVGFINDRLGSKLSAEEISKLLANVEFDVQANGEELTVKAPFWRTDIEIPEDVVEEVGRLYGYDKLPIELPKRSIKPATTDPLLALKTQIRGKLCAAGANEVLTYSFIHGDLINKVGQDKTKAFELANAISPDLQYYRLSLLPSLLDKVHANIKQGFNEFGLFELNTTHNKDLVGEDGLPLESQRLGFVFAAEDKLARQNYHGAAYFVAKKYLNTLMADLGIEQVVFEDLSDQAPKTMSQAAAALQKERSALIKTKDGEPIGLLGEFKALVRKNLKLPAFIAGFELGLEPLIKLSDVDKNYQPIPRFPKLEQDITLKVPARLSYGEVKSFLDEFTSESLKEHIPDKTISQFTPLDIYQKAPSSKNITFRFTVASYERTLTTDEVNTILEKIAEAAKAKLGAERI